MYLLKTGWLRYWEVRWYSESRNEPSVMSSGALATMESCTHRHTHTYTYGTPLYEKLCTVNLTFFKSVYRLTFLRKIPPPVFLWCSQRSTWGHWRHWLWPSRPVTLPTACETWRLERGWREERGLREERGGSEAEKGEGGKREENLSPVLTLFHFHLLIDKSLRRLHRWFWGWSSFLELFSEPSVCRPRENYTSPVEGEW